jgi:hypothetical protein
MLTKDWAIDHTPLSIQKDPALMFEQDLSTVLNK